MKTILLIGSGKLAHHLAHWHNLNQKNNSKLLTWDRHQDPHAIHRYATDATHIWLAISDAAVVPFFDKYLSGHDAKVVHFSGALHDPRLISVHPLMSFSEKLYEDAFYSQIQFALTGTDQLSDALPGFENSFFVVKPEDKPLYHALCVVAGNFPQLLWNEVTRIAQEKNIPVSAFDLYIRQIAENFVSLKQKSLTGPFVRKDLETIQKNIQALQPTKLQSIYQSFEKEFVK